MNVLLWFEENLRSGILKGLDFAGLFRLWFEENLRSGILSIITRRFDVFNNNRRRLL